MQKRGIRGRAKYAYEGAIFPWRFRSAHERRLAIMNRQMHIDIRGPHHRYVFEFHGRMCPLLASAEPGGQLHGYQQERRASHLTSISRVSENTPPSHLGAPSCVCSPANVVYAAR